MSMRADPLERVDVLCGGSRATQELRTGIAKFANEQAKHFLRMHDPAWVDRAIQSPDWARGQLQLCRRAVEEGIATMESHIAPFCEELAQMETQQSGISLDRVMLKMPKKWSSLKEVGSCAINRYIHSLEKGPSPFSPQTPLMQIGDDRADPLLTAPPPIEFSGRSPPVEIAFTR